MQFNPTLFNLTQFITQFITRRRRVFVSSLLKVAGVKFLVRVVKPAGMGVQHVWDWLIFPMANWLLPTSIYTTSGNDSNKLRWICPTFPTVWV